MMKTKTRTLPFVIGVATAYGFAVTLLVFALRLGILPVQADAAQSRLEASLLGSALHASVARHAPTGGNPQPSPETDSIMGATIYRQMCSRCHGLTDRLDNTYGQSFYPPAPNLAVSGTTFSEGEIFWIVKHGIRNTAMPAWGSLLTDEEIWRVAGVVRKLNSTRNSESALQTGF
jgi:mono/diheme cytochrome c family protein